MLYCFLEVAPLFKQSFEVPQSPLEHLVVLWRLNSHLPHLFFDFKLLVVLLVQFFEHVDDGPPIYYIVFVWLVQLAVSVQHDVEDLATIAFLEDPFALVAVGVLSAANDSLPCLFIQDMRQVLKELHLLH